MNTAKLVSFAIEQLGEGSTESYAYAKVTSGSWCAMFVRYCCANASGEGACGTSNLASGLYGSLNKSKETFSTSKKPKVGDLAFIAYDGGTSIGHVSIITYVGTDKITTINGNWGGKVKYQDYKADGTSTNASTIGRIYQIGRNS